MEKRDDKKPNGNGIYLIFCFAILLIVCALLGAAHERDNKELYKERDLSPTAGITYYMSSLEKACMDGATPDLDYIETYFDTVSAAKAAEEEARELEEIENERRNKLNAYFGYVPDDDEITLWQKIVMDECGYTEPDSGIAAVADCIANRCRSDAFPNTISGVVYQPGQFQPVGDNTLGRFEITERVYEICADCISEGQQYGYLFFKTNGYHSGRTPGEKIGDHYFSY